MVAPWNSWSFPFEPHGRPTVLALQFYPVYRPQLPVEESMGAVSPPGQRILSGHIDSSVYQGHQHHRRDSYNSRPAHRRLACEWSTTLTIILSLDDKPDHYKTINHSSRRSIDIARSVEGFSSAVLPSYMLRTACFIVFHLHFFAGKSCPPRSPRPCCPCAVRLFCGRRPYSTTYNITRQPRRRASKMESKTSPVTRRTPRKTPEW